MQKITTSRDLKVAIQELETKQAEAWILVKSQFLTVVETLKPVNLLTDAVKKIFFSPDLKTNVIKSVFGLATGVVITKLFFIGKTSNPISKLLTGAIVGMATSAGAFNAATRIKSMGDVLFKKTISE
jgi:hypothetical protein